jgi:hypothetical protein
MTIQATRGKHHLLSLLTVRKRLATTTMQITAMVAALQRMVTNSGETLTKIRFLSLRLLLHGYNPQQG